MAAAASSGGDSSSKSGAAADGSNRTAGDGQSEQKTWCALTLPPTRRAATQTHARRHRQTSNGPAKGHASNGEAARLNETDALCVGKFDAGAGAKAAHRLAAHSSSTSGSNTVACDGIKQRPTQKLAGGTGANSSV